MKTHDLNARTLELMREKGIPWREARSLLSSHAAAAREGNRRRTAREQRRTSRFREIADKISP